MMSPRVRTWVRGTAIALCGLVAAASPLRAATVIVEAKPGALAAAVARAAPGDHLHLKPGVYQGGIVLRKPLTIEGQPGTILDGMGVGHVVSVFAPDVVLRGLTLRNSGSHAIDFDGGIYVEDSSPRFTAENNHLDGTLFGIVLRGAQHAVLRGNIIRSRSDLFETALGDGIYLRNGGDDVVEGNDISGGRDGIFSEGSHRNQILRNRMTHLRFATHYMYSNQNKIIGNFSAHNVVGFALMYSNEMEVRDNVSIDDHEHGLMFHTSYHSVVTGNYVRGTQDKGIFIYTAAKNEISGNRVENCQIGLYFTGGSEDNQIYGNAFINNRTQVKFTGTVTYEWSKDGRGNYWSDNTAFDLDGKGLAATAYRPNSVMDRLVWRYPLAKSLMSSPVMEALRFAQSQFPALMPGGVIDSHPLMAPPPLPPGLPSLNEVGS